MRYSILICIFIATLWISCSDEDALMQQSSNGDPATIIGQWNVTSTVVQLSVEGQPLKDYLISTGMSGSDAQNNVELTGHQTNWEGLFSSFDFKSDGKWAVTTNNETASGLGTWSITSDQKKLTIRPDNADQDIIAAVLQLTASDLQLGIELESQPKFGTTVDYVVHVQATRPQN